MLLLLSCISSTHEGLCTPAQPINILHAQRTISDRRSSQISLHLKSQSAAVASVAENPQAHLTLQP